MIQVRYISILKRLQVVKIGYIPKPDQISRILLKNKNSFFIQIHRIYTCQIGLVLYNSYKISTYLSYIISRLFDTYIVYVPV